METEIAQVKEKGDLTIQWAAIAAVAGASAAVIGALAFGMGFASLPLRVTSLEQKMDVLQKELKDGRSDRLVFQGETSANFARIEGKIDNLRIILEREINKKP